MPECKLHIGMNDFQVGFNVDLIFKYLDICQWNNIDHYNSCNELLLIKFPWNLKISSFFYLKTNLTISPIRAFPQKRVSQNCSKTKSCYSFYMPTNTAKRVKKKNIKIEKRTYSMKRAWESMLRVLLLVLRTFFLSALCRSFSACNSRRTFLCYIILVAENESEVEDDSKKCCLYFSGE